ncbi:histidine phosphatase superfamily [Pelagophyceae sp. CCMP2097]|nr:histidine phosphatase superfamily [Pelagophyceae sp. CCMP2097]|mmetsp:Transcript_12102/g.41819  ORF Transcript_12102/g.41819 Transcript_12102/m.41819 type:complete len:272 (+) Transcript_12102:90-905(+)
MLLVPLYSASALATAQLEGAQHLEGLRAQGCLGLERAVEIRARAWDGGAAPPGCKIVHLIRHGQGFHNLLADVYRDFGRSVDATGLVAGDSPYTRPELLDPPLTAVGRAQAKSLQPATLQLGGIELVVVSPLLRAVQTAALAMPHLKAAVPWVAHPFVQEQSGKHTCDKRRAREDLVDDFPLLDVTLVDEGDSLWTEQREPMRAVSDRGHDFLLWLHARPEAEIAVATHSAWLFTLLNTACVCAEPELATWFQTGEFRSLILEFDTRPDAV